MRNSQLLHFLLALVLFVTSCGDDDSGTNDEVPEPMEMEEPQSDLIGSWNITDADFSIQINEQDFIQYFIDLLFLTEEEAEEFEDLFLEETEVNDFEEFEQVVFTFNDDGTYIITDPVDGDESGTYTVNSDETELTFTTDGESTVLQIETLTATQLTLIIAEEDSSEDLDEDGQVDTITIRVELYMTKI